MKAILGFCFALTSAAASAESITILTLQRTNYKPEKQLVYDVMVDPTSCELSKQAPFDVYYVNNSTGERLPSFSADSREYFGPRVNPATTTAHQALLEFKAFDEIQNETGIPAQIAVTTVKDSSKGCGARAVISYSGKSYVLVHIDLAMKLTFGFPSGVDWVRLEGLDGSGDVRDCVIGACR